MVHREYTRNVYFIECFQEHLGASQKVTCPHFASLPSWEIIPCIFKLPKSGGLQGFMSVCVCVDNISIVNYVYFLVDM